MNLKIFFTFVVLLIGFSRHLESHGHLAHQELPSSGDALFLQRASGAVLKADPDVPQQYRLILRGIAPSATYLKGSDYRSAGVIALKDFLELWKGCEHSFEPFAVTASLSFKPTVMSEQQTAQLKLSHPTYRPSSNTLEFIVKFKDKGEEQTGRFKNIILVSSGFQSWTDPLKSEYKTNREPALPLLTP